MTYPPLTVSDDDLLTIVFSLMSFHSPFSLYWKRIFRRYFSFSWASEDGEILILVVVSFPSKSITISSALDKLVAVNPLNLYPPLTLLVLVGFVLMFPISLDFSGLLVI